MMGTRRRRKRILLLWEGDLLSQNVNVCWYESASTLVCESLKSEGFPNDGWDAIYKVVGSGKTEVGVCVNGYSYKAVTIYTFDDEDYFGAEKDTVKVVCWATGGINERVKILYQGETRQLSTDISAAFAYIDPQDARKMLFKYPPSNSEYDLRTRNARVYDNLRHSTTIRMESYYLSGIGATYSGSVVSANGTNITVRPGTVLHFKVSCIGPDCTPCAPSWYTECPGIVSFTDNGMGEEANSYVADLVANRPGTVNVGVYIPGVSTGGAHVRTITVVEDSGTDPYA